MRFAGGSLWVGSNVGTTVFRIDPATNAVTRIDVGQQSPSSFAARGSSVWVMNRNANTVSRLDPGSNKVVALVRVGRVPIEGTVASDGSVWIPDQADNRLVRIDPATNAVDETVKVGAGPTVVNEAFGDLWVGSFKGRDVWRIRPR
jgi:YVTN family beta-propeller protein